MSLRVRINPIACDAHVMSVELLPELFGFEDRGYPIIEIGLVPDQVERIAQMAGDAYPTLAIVIEEAAGVGRQH